MTSLLHINKYNLNNCRLEIKKKRFSKTVRKTVSYCNLGAQIVKNLEPKVLLSKSAKHYRNAFKRVIKFAS